jgi:REP element-mobilizing transposase RayT
MPRKARIDAPGAVHHIMARGIERRSIFRHDEDRDDFIDRLSRILTEAQTPCYAWALIPNHFHLLLRTGAVPISNIMRRLLAGYAQSFNRRHRRHGHLFQNRYKSILCQEDTYLLELVRYIHLNPMRANVVADLRRLNTYRYCGHGVLLGKRQLEFQQTDAVLSRFAGTVKKARSLYREYVKKGVSQGRRPSLSGGGLVRSAGGWSAVTMLRKSGLFQKSDERILGDGDFVESILRQANERLEHTLSIKSQGYDLQTIIQRVSVLLDLPIKDIQSASKRSVIVKARNMVCYWAYTHLGMNQTELALKFGISQPAVCAAVQKGQKIIEQNRHDLIITK